MNYRFLPVAACLAVLLSACDGGSSPLQAEGVRPGADRQVAASTRLPPAVPPAGYGAPVVAEEPGRDARIGSIVPAAGGQQAQKAEEQKAIAGIKREWSRERESETSRATVPAPPSAEAPAVQ